MTIPTHEIDRNSLTWRAVAGWAAEQIEDHLYSLEMGLATPGANDRCRGKIEMLRKLLSLGDAATEVAPTIESPSDYHA